MVGPADGWLIMLLDLACQFSLNSVYAASRLLGNLYREIRRPFPRTREPARLHSITCEWAFAGFMGLARPAHLSAQEIHELFDVADLEGIPDPSDSGAVLVPI